MGPVPIVREKSSPVDLSCGCQVLSTKSFLNRMNKASLLSQFAGVMRERYGKDLACYEESFLVKSIERRQEATACRSLQEYLERLKDDRLEVEAFTSSLQVCYSEFFRNPLTFSILEQVVLPSLLEEKTRSGNREIRIWSAACSAGQEAYSVAILLQDLEVARGSPVSFRIIASDVCESALASARTGVFDRSALQNVRLRHLQEYFSEQDHTHVVAPLLRSHVDFSFYDLLDQRSVCPPTSLYGDFDLILCCNLLFYYKPAIQQRILEKFERALAPGGYFVTGEAERDAVTMQVGLLRAVNPATAVFRRT